MMKIKMDEEKLILSGNELFGMIGIVAMFLFCVGIYLLLACIWPKASSWTAGSTTSIRNPACSTRFKPQSSTA